MESSTMDLLNVIKIIDNIGNSTSLCQLFPQTVGKAAAPLVSWIILVLSATFISPSSSIGALSINRSLTALFTRRYSKLDILDVFRVAAILWVILNHTGSEGRVDILDQQASGDDFKKSIHEHPIFGSLFGNSALGVEIFLVLSGLLAARSWLRRADEPFFQHWSNFIYRRIIRLAPSVFVFVYIASGPLMRAILPRYSSTMIDSCGVQGILSHLTFTSNWQSVPTCMGYLWYIGLDFQLYIAAPIFINLLNSKPFWGFMASISTIIVSCIVRGAYCIGYDTCNKSDVDIPFIAFPGQSEQTVQNIYAGLWDMYARPYTKCGPFIVGILLGYMTTKVELELTKKQSNQMLIGSFLLSIITIYAILPEYWHPENGTTLYNLIYTSTFRTIFALSIALMIFALFYKKGKREPVSPIFSVMAKLTYNAYLLHMPIVYVFNWLPYLQTATSPIQLLTVLPFVTVFAYLASFLFYIFFEAPICYILSQI